MLNEFTLWIVCYQGLKKTLEWMKRSISLIQFVPGQKSQNRILLTIRVFSTQRVAARWGLLTCWWWLLSQFCPMFFESSFWVMIIATIKSFIWAFENEVILPQILCGARQAINRSLHEQVSKQHTFLLIALLAYFMRLISLLDRNLELPQVHSLLGEL